MKIFLDTSSLFKLYHREFDTEIIEKIFSDSKITHIYLSEFTKIEFAYTIWKKVRTNEINESQAKITLDLFETDSGKYIFIPTDALIIAYARVLIFKHGIKGLRSLDSIQLACSCTLQGEVDYFLSSDKLLNSLFKEENLPANIPIG